jgi:hypothetical protein
LPDEDPNSLVPKTEQLAKTIPLPPLRRSNFLILWLRGNPALDIRELVSELKRQRRHLDQAIAALEALEKRKRPERRNPVSRKLKIPPVPPRKTGTAGQLIPFSIAPE